MLFVPVETGMNTLHFTYLLAWWYRESVTSHITEFYFL